MHAFYIRLRGLKMVASLYYVAVEVSVEALVVSEKEHTIVLK